MAFLAKGSSHTSDNLALAGSTHTLTSLSPLCRRCMSVARGPTGSALCTRHGRRRATVIRLTLLVYSMRGRRPVAGILCSPEKEKFACYQYKQGFSRDLKEASQLFCHFQRACKSLLPRYSRTDDTLYVTMQINVMISISKTYAGILHAHVAYSFIYLLTFQST